MLRSEIQSQTELGLIAREQMEKGELLPDELMIALVKKRVAEEDCQRCGWILDGFPRTVRQANLMHKAGIDPDVVIELDRPDEMVREWCLGRFHDAATVRGMIMIIMIMTMMPQVGSVGPSHHHVYV